jgi:meso-butanediol dehydrogenase / (S,S)-butanediol dehydrogenase / diacetyl reductase
VSGRLEDKTAIVTGAGQGIGEGIARRFAEEGATVVVTDFDGEQAEAVAAACGGNSWGTSLDVTDSAAVDACVAQIEMRHGRIDVLANNAGVIVVGGPTEVEERAWDLAFDVNVKGVWRMMKAAWPIMVRQGGGSIINQSSCAAKGGMPRNLGYCATKGAVTLMTQSAALDGGAHRIRVNCVCPGFVDTPMSDSFFEEQPDPAAARRDAAAAHPLGHMGTPEDIGNAFVYLASDEASWVTGTVLSVDGGLTASM